MSGVSVSRMSPSKSKTRARITGERSQWKGATVKLWRTGREIGIRGWTRAGNPLIYRPMQKLLPLTGRSVPALAAIIFLATVACSHTRALHPPAAVPATPTMTHNRAEIPDKYKWDVAPIFANWAAWEDGMK